MNETKQPSLDDSTAPTNIFVLHTNTPPLNNQRDTNNIFMLHHKRNVSTPNKPCTPNASAPNNVCKHNASASNNACKPNASANYDKRYYTLISFKSLRELETLANIGKKLTNKLKKKKYVGLALGRRLLGQVILQCPKVGGAALALIISLSVSAFLANCDLTSLLPNVNFFLHPSTLLNQSW